MVEHSPQILASKEKATATTIRQSNFFFFFLKFFLSFKNVYYGSHCNKNHLFWINNNTQELIDETPNESSANKEKNTVITVVVTWECYLMHNQKFLFQNINGWHRKVN